MEAAIEFFVQQGSYLLMFAALLVAGLGVPLPEDIVMISGAILAQRGITDLGLTVAVLAAGVLAGDTLLFFVARRVGTAVYKWKIVRRVMPEARRTWVEAKIDKHGGLVVFFARHVAGFRGATFALCAIHGISYPRFILWDALALIISLPLWMGIGWFFGDSMDQLANQTATAERIVLLVVLGAILLFVVGHALARLLKRSRDPEPSEASEPGAPSEPSEPAEPSA